MPLLAEAGADAFSVGQTNDLARSRQTLEAQLLLFGNIDPFKTLAKDDETSVRCHESPDFDRVASIAKRFGASSEKVRFWIAEAKGGDIQEKVA